MNSFSLNLEVPLYVLILNSIVEFKIILLQYVALQKLVKSAYSLIIPIQSRGNMCIYCPSVPMKDIEQRHHNAVLSCVL